MRDKGNLNLKGQQTPEPDHMVVYRAEGVYQLIRLCEYLRELSEDPGREPESKYSQSEHESAKD